MKTKLLAILMAVTMVFAMAPLTAGVAFADEESADPGAVEFTEPDVEAFDIEAPAQDDIAVKASNDLPSGCMLYVGDKLVTKKTAKGKGWKFTYKNKKGTLTLNKANITVSSQPEDSSETFGIISMGMPLNIVLKGKNKVTVTGEDSMAVACGNGNLTISGKGSLNAQADDYGIGNEGGKTVIKNATVIATGKYEAGIRTERLSINKAKVTAKTSSDGRGVYVVKPVSDSTSSGLNMALGKLTIKKSKFTAKGGYVGVVAGNTTVSKSTVTANISKGMIGMQCKKLYANNSKITAQGEFAGIYVVPQEFLGEEPSTTTTATVKNSILTGKGEMTGVSVYGTLNLIKTKKGKYSTKVDGQLLDSESPVGMAYAVAALTIKAKVKTPKGGKIVNDTESKAAYVVNKSGNSAKHVVLVPKK